MGYLMLIRHSYRQYRNNRSPKGTLQHDSPIKPCHQREIARKFLYLFSKYGYPKKIICSPFLRTRETAKIIKKILPADTEIIIDKEVEEFLGFQKPKGGIPDLDEETKKYTSPKLGIETFEDIKVRSKKFYDRVKNPEEDTIVITHGIFISQLGVQLDIKFDKSVDELCGFVIVDNEKIKI